MQARIKKIRDTLRKRIAAIGDGGKQSRTRAIVAVVVIVAILVAGTFYLARRAGANGGLSSSGTIEATQVRISPELSGQVVEVLVSEGDQVEAGDVLLRLDDALLQNQRDQALATLAQAEAAHAAAELELEAAQQNYDDLFDNLDLAVAEAQDELANARDAVRDAERDLYDVSYPGDQTDIDSARATVVLAREALEQAQEDYQPYANKSEDNLVRANRQLRLSAAQEAYDDAVRRLNNLESAANEIDISIAAADLEVARARLAQAEEDYAALENGPNPDQLALADRRLRGAQTQLDAANANVAAAQAALDSADIQIEKSELCAPSTGTILYRNTEPGEFVAPGTTVIVLAQLDELTITVYVSEDRYGEVQLGDGAEIEVDSFPGEVFQANVVRIADQAEFTPRNVQTGEGRRTTVFAIELRLDDPAGKLKPGMPADVYFSR
jgi:HlyD family secretion protein